MIILLKKIEGFILTETPNGENSKILNILTKEHGLIGAIAKGVKSSKNPLRSKASKYTYGIFYLDYYDNKLSKLEDIDVINSFKEIKKDIIKISYLAYICDLTYQVVKENYQNSIYENFINAILKIEAGLNPMVLTNILEIKYLDYLGVRLNLESCVYCGSKKNIVTIDPDAGGFICQECYHNELIINTKIINLLRKYYLVKISSITKLNINESSIFLINRFLNQYYERFTGLYLQSKKFLNTLVNQ